MSLQKLSKQVMWAILIALLVVGCGAPAATSTLVPPTATPTLVPPTATLTPVPPTGIPTPTSETLPETVAEGIEVTFDGNDCTVIGPPELPTGEHTFVFIDRSDMKGELWLVNLDDGKTTQDLLNGQSEPGNWYPKPSWTHYDLQQSNKSEELEGRRVDTSTWKLDKVGEHTIVCYVASPQMIWFAASLMIIEAPSE